MSGRQDCEWGAGFKAVGKGMRLRGGGEGTGVVPGFNIETGQWGRVDEQTGKELRGEGDSGEEDSEEMGTTLSKHKDVVTVDQLVEYAASEAGEGNYDCAADLLLVAIEELEDKEKDEEDAPELGDVYLRYAEALVHVAAQRKGQPGGSSGAAGGGTDAVKEAWEYGNKAVVSLGRIGHSGLSRKAEAHALLLEILRGTGAAEELGITGEGLLELVCLHEAGTEDVRRSLMAANDAARKTQDGGGEGEVVAPDVARPMDG